MISSKNRYSYTPLFARPFFAGWVVYLLVCAILCVSIQPLQADVKATSPQPVPQKAADAKPTPAKPVPAEILKPPKNVEDLRKLEDRVKKAVAKVLTATVAIRIGSGSGSGVIVSPDGYILTAGHVVEKPGQKARVILADGKEVEAVTLGVYRSSDAGMLKITEGSEEKTGEDKDKKTGKSNTKKNDGKPAKTVWPFAEQGKRDDIKLGMWCIVLGHPLGKQKDRPPVVRIGRVLKIQKQTLQTDCPLVGGDSGGPLADLDGRIIGINSRISGDIAMNYHVPIGVFRENWERLKKGDDWQDDFPKRDSKNVKSAFRNVVAQAAKCVARVKCDGKDAILGTIVGPDGWILTKASELKGRIVCRLRDGRDLEARIVGVDPRFDLAMLKIDATDLPVIPWTLKETAVGNLVAAAGMDDVPLAIGVVSAPNRTIPHSRAAIGVLVKDGAKGPKVLAV
ncbi:MAG: trypsin-like peptidase domain-containing protein, partial [Pirellulales bacterium]|nr:trypsin-like peptidase domain-containing protein [Pirellulales bacterium]